MRAYRIRGATAEQRAREVAAATATELSAALAGYDALFAVAGLTHERIRQLADDARQALLDWAPDLAAELDLLARACQLEPWRIHALNARTELLAAAGAASRGECSTVAGRGEDGRTIGVQTWDWHQELGDCWSVLSYPDAPLRFATLTEPAMLAKIGLNAAGVGLLFNILGHHQDTGAGGVAVHAVARRILDTARSVEAAIEVLRSAPLAASSCFTVLDAHRIACLEAGPAGVAEVAAAGAWVVHTNHFLDPALAAGGLPVSADSDTEARAALLRSRLAGDFGASPAGRLFELLCAHESDGAAICCHPPAAGPLGTRWQSLATVQLEPAARTLTVLAGGPCQREAVQGDDGLHEAGDDAGQHGAEQRRFQVGTGQV